MKILLGFVAALMVASVSSLHVKFIPCKGDTVESVSVEFIDVSPCTEDPCALSRGSTYEVSASFNTGAAPVGIEGVETHLYGIIAGVKVPFPGFNQTDGCKNSGLTCPLGPKAPYTFAIPIFIDPKVTIDISCVVELRLVDTGTGKDLICNELQVKVVN
ncbi:NPC intracellular cholesterol transporter 2-like [Sycon ciliatum]|uniref:NPC intracellular cholesterol transporter 2-like n=1 Tax=Sycon ciliatum TaxID=27933 RepID=UPI0020AC1CBC|eukprot:scpid94666/ scgid26083/ Epididymal secretory protein E1; 16.5 kDa secretory protein; Niemann Pick type C2 protein homolog